MRCKVLLFAQLAEAVGCSRLTIDRPDGATVADAIEALSKEHAAIALLREGLAFALDDRYCNATTTLNDGQTLALIPPVSGG